LTTKILFLILTLNYLYGIIDNEKVYLWLAGGNKVQEMFITNIHIGNVRHLENIDIVLSETERKHLILTGKNGSGKTSLLQEIRDFTEAYKKHGFGSVYLSNSGELLDFFKDYQVSMRFSHEANCEERNNNFLLAYIGARKGRIPDLSAPKQIEKTPFMHELNTSNDMVNTRAMQYMNSLKLRAAYPKSVQEKELIENWFDSFQSALAEIYDCPELKLVYDAEHLDFIIELPNRKPFTLNQMSDGYFAFVSILFEIILRLDNGEALVDYRRDGIVLIDELESHLHVELQKRALPFLTKIFSNTQFIVATHSPFIISSSANAVVYDLETKTRLEGDLTQYSYSDIVEGYFDESECSAALQADFDRYVKLVEQTSRTDSEKVETRNLFERLSKIPGTSPLSTAFYMFERGRRNGKAQ
jgi:predicted ATP-binding protein involved in virulence